MERLACVQAIFFDAQERPVKGTIAQEQNSRACFFICTRQFTYTVDDTTDRGGKIISVFDRKIISV